jgi:hypothetical protein
MYYDIEKKVKLDLSGKSIKVYRGINLPYKNPYIKSNPSVIDHYIPFSCSWSRDFVLDEWTHSHLLEIELPCDYPFITLSHPSYDRLDSSGKNINSFNYKGSKIKLKNQGQYELCVPPSKFEVTGTSSVKHNEKDICIICVKPKPKPIPFSDTAAFIFPKPPDSTSSK